MEKIEINNAREEILEIAEKCNKCGLCKEICPVMRALREEALGPRGHMILFSNKIFEKQVFDCSLCKACEEKCPLDIKVCEAIKKARVVLNLRNKDHPANKEILKKIKNKENPYSD